MGKSTPVPPSSPVFRQLEDFLRKPEPMCLVIVNLLADGDIWATAEYRLRENMRQYDQLWRLHDGSYALAIKTLADANTLQASIERMFLLLSDPYAIEDGYERAVVQLGAAVRHPQDTAASLIDRVGEAIQAAEAKNCSGPVLR